MSQTVETAIVSILGAESDITDLVEDRIVPFIENAVEGLPALAYYIIDSDSLTVHPSEGQSGNTNVEHPTISIQVFTETRSEAASLARIVKRVLHCYCGTIENIRICPSLFVDKSEISAVPLDGKETPVFRIELQFRLQVQDSEG